MGGGVPAAKVKGRADWRTSGHLFPKPYSIRRWITIRWLPWSHLGFRAVLVLDETVDLIDLVERITMFFEHESCGKCTPCREGTKRMHEILQKINRGKGTVQDIVLAERLSLVMSKASLCGLGQAASGPVVTTLQHFRPEYDAKLQL